MLKEGTGLQDQLSWLMGQIGAAAGLTIELFAGRSVINRGTAKAQIELVEQAIKSLAPDYEMKSLAWLPAGKKKGVVGPYDKPGWKWQKEGIAKGDYRKHAAVAWKGEDRSDFFLIASERTSSADSIRISTSLKYVSALCEDVDRAEQLVQLTRTAWSKLKLRYGYGSLGVTDEGMVHPNAERIIGDWGDQSRIPLANFTPSHDARIAASLGKKVKGAFWLNLLNEDHVKALGGIEAIDPALPENIRLEEFKKGGVLIQLTPTPAPDSSLETQAKYGSLARLLEPIMAE